MYEEFDNELSEQLRERLEIETYEQSISQEIKDDVHEYKKKTTKFMDKVKTAFFVYLIAKKGTELYNKRVDKEYKVYIKDVDKLVKASMKKFNIKDVDTSSVNDIMERFKIDKASVKTEDDKYMQVIKEFYSKTLKTLDKEWISEKDYLSAKVDEFDKVEKVVRYNRIKKDGNFVYFDIASYDSMVFNTNLTRTGIRETIKDSLLRNYDVVYIDPHPFSCPLCQSLQGKFYSITGETTIYEGMEIESLEDAQNQGLFHPNCTHIPRKAYPEDRVSDRYTSEEWEERYNARQKLNALELQRDRLKSDTEIYEKLGNMEQVDKNKQKISVLNKKMQDERNAMKGIQNTNYQDYKYQQKQKELLKKQKEQEKIQKEKQIKKELQKQSSQTHKEMQELFKIRENRPKYISQLEEKQQKLKEVQQIIRKNEKDMKYWNAKQEELSLKVDIKNLKELINK